MLRDTGNQRVGISHVNHHRTENVPVVDQRFGFRQSDTAALPQTEKFLRIELMMLGGHGIDDLHSFEIHTELAGAGLNLRRVAEQDRMADLFLDQSVAGSQNFFVVAFRKYHLFGIGLCLVDHGPRDFVGFPEPALQLSAVGIEIDRFLRHAGTHRSLGNGGSLPHQHTGIEGFRDQIFAAELQAGNSISAANGVGNILFRQVGESLGGRQFHFFVDGGGPHVEGSAKDEGESENVVDLVGIIRASGGDDDITAAGFGLLIGNFGIRIGHGKDNRVRRHRTHHVGSDRTFHGEAGEYVRTGQSLG